MAWTEGLAGAWGMLVAVLTVTGAVVASGHAILYKRDTRATVLWVGFIWLAPLAGAICYLLLGINRIKRRASMLRRLGPRLSLDRRGDREAFEADLPPFAVQKPNFRRLVRMVHAVTDLPLTPGNDIRPLFNGDEAFPEMLRAIDDATVSIALCTYIFDRDWVGLEFADALKRAFDRGVQVRVLVDDTGVRYSFPTIVGVLRRAGIPVARFLPTLAPFRTFALNMRSHRKLLVVDGRIGFTGGMNIRAGNVADAGGVRRICDIHFRIEGPVVEHMREVFADDWLFTTAERLEGAAWQPDLQPVGDVHARGIADGPDEELDRLRWTILGGLASALERVCIFTPYFLPDPGLITALNTCSLRGVAVEIVMPKKNNLPFLQWASNAHLWQVLERGCRVFFAPGPFDHSKVMLVDGEWSLIGSANWDPRSMRLNFEFNVECYSNALTSRLMEWFERRMAEAREVTLAEMNCRGLLPRLRDGIARLATPFL